MKRLDIDVKVLSMLLYRREPPNDRTLKFNSIGINHYLYYLAITDMVRNELWGKANEIPWELES